MPCISQFYNKYSNQRCFILGNGPSLNNVDLNQLSNEISFGVNSIFLMDTERNFRPTFYVVEDNMVFKDNIQQIDAYKGVIKILPKEYSSQLSNQQEHFVFDMNTSFYNKNSEFYSIPQFNTGKEPEFFCGQTVTYINLQLAYYMGFSEIILLGMDFNYVKPSNHHQNGNHIMSYGDDPNHFSKQYFGKGKTWKDPRLGRVLRSYIRAKYEIESSGRTIVNATPGGKLEIFNRNLFDAFFS